LSIALIFILFIIIFKLTLIKWGFHLLECSLNIINYTLIFKFWKVLLDLLDVVAVAVPPERDRPRRVRGPFLPEGIRGPVHREVSSRCRRTVRPHTCFGKGPIQDQARCGERSAVPAKNLRTLRGVGLGAILAHSSSGSLQRRPEGRVHVLLVIDRVRDLRDLGRSRFVRSQLS
jgi:hypothetical protein